MRKISFIIISMVVLTSFSESGTESIAKYERLVLQSNKPGTEYVVDLTGIKGCNKSKVKYLGLVETKKGKKYKVVTSFFVFATTKDMCHASSDIKIYDVANRFIGKYYVGMPNELPDTLIGSKLVYSKNSEECPLKKGVSIDLSNGLPKNFFIPCSKNGGNEYGFSD